VKNSLKIIEKKSSHRADDVLIYYECSRKTEQIS